MSASAHAPHIDWKAISPLLALTGGLCLLLMVSLFRAAFVRTKLVPALTLLALGATAGLGIWTWGDNVEVIEGALTMDDLALALTMVFVAAPADCAVSVTGTTSAPAATSPNACAIWSTCTIPRPS